MGEQAGEEIKLNNVILDSWQSENSITGPGDLTIMKSLLWHAGGISGAGTVFLHGDADAVLEGTGTKMISERIFDVEGSLETESLLNLTLQQGAQLHINRTSQWTHTGGGTIKKGYGDMPAIIITETFRKKGTGALVVEADFVCEGEMFLDEGVLTVQGAFDLQEDGKIFGGGTDATSDNLRLIVIEASSAILAGIIEVDAEGDPALMSILGAVTIQPTFEVLIDIPTTGQIPAERLSFLTGGVALDGMLTVDVQAYPPFGVPYRVISTIQGTGQFNAIIGANVFTTWQEDSLGVLLVHD